MVHLKKPTLANTVGLLAWPQGMVPQETIPARYIEPFCRGQVKLLVVTLDYR